MSFKDLDVSEILDIGTTEMFVSRELIWRVPGYKVQHAADDRLRIQLPNGDEVQNKGQVILKANIEKLQVTFKAHILNIM